MGAADVNELVRGTLNFSMSQQITQMLIRESIKKDTLNRLGARVLASLPGSATANMENVFDAFTVSPGSQSNKDQFKNVMDFLDQIKDEKGGTEVVKEMLNPVNETGFLINSLVVLIQRGVKPYRIGCKTY